MSRVPTGHGNLENHGMSWKMKNCLESHGILAFTLKIMESHGILMIS